MKIAIVPPGTLPLPAVKGGAVESLVDLFEMHNNNNNNELTIFSIYDPEIKNIGSSNYVYFKIPIYIKLLDKIIFKIAKNVVHLNKPTSYRYLAQRLYFINKVSNYLYRNDFDRVVLENHETLLLALKRHRNYKKYKGKYYYHMHNTFNNFYGCKNILLNSAAIIGVSNYILSTLPDDIKKRVPLVKLENRVDENKFNGQISSEEKDNYRKRFDLKNKKVILFSGRFNKEKGIDKLLNAWKKANPKNSDLLLVGSAFFKSGAHSAFQESIEKIAKSMKNVKFTGFIDYKEMPKLYALADIVVLPSVWNDPAPLTVIETLTSHKPLITTNSGGISEYAKGNAIILERDTKLVDNLAGYLQKIDKQSISTTSINKTWLSKDYYDKFISILNCNGASLKNIEKKI